MEVNINDFRLRPGGYCPLEKLEWLDENNNSKDLNLYFNDGPLEGQSKGLKQISIELGLNLQHLKLDDLKNELKMHPAFVSRTKLEILAEKYNVKIIFCPKFHCELNPIEG